MFAKLSKTGSDSADSKNPIVSSVPLLFFCCGPTAIPGLVVSVSVNSINGFSCWFFSHVLKKSKERLPPSTYLDSPSPVVLEAPLVWVFASCEHSSPTLISFGHRLSPRSMSMNETCSGNNLSPKAFTGLGCSGDQMCVHHRDNIPTSAFANTGPLSFSAGECSYWGFGNNFKSSEPSSNEVRYFRHNGIALCSAVGFGYRPNARRDCFLSENQGHVNAL